MDLKEIFETLPNSRKLELYQICKHWYSDHLRFAPVHSCSDTIRILNRGVIGEFGKYKLMSTRLFNALDIHFKNVEINMEDILNLDPKRLKLLRNVGAKVVQEFEYILKSYNEK